MIARPKTAVACLALLAVRTAVAAPGGPAPAPTSNESTARPVVPMPSASAAQPPASTPSASNPPGPAPNEVPTTRVSTSGDPPSVEGGMSSVGGGAVSVAGSRSTAPVATNAGVTIGPVVPLVFTQADLFFHPDESEGENGFSFARFRAGAWAEPTSWSFVLASFEWSRNESPAVVDGFVTLRLLPRLRLTVGQARNPLFVSARTELEGTTPLPELSVPVRALWPGRDVGVELHYAPEEVPLEFWFRLGNGSPGLLGNDNDSFATSARLDATAGRARYGSNGRDPLGLRVGFGVHHDNTEDRAGVGGSLPSGFVFFRPPTVSSGRTIAEGHVLAYVGPVRALFEVGAAHEDRLVDDDGNPQTPRVAIDPVRSSGASFELSWMVTGEYRRAGTWPSRAAQSTFRWRDVGFEVAGRAERVQVGRGTHDLVPGGSSGGEFAATAWLSSFASFALAADAFHYDTPPIESPERKGLWLLQSRLTVYLNPPPAGAPDVRNPDAGVPVP